MKYEKIKIGETIYDIANGSCGLDRPGDIATVAIVIGTNAIDDIHRTLTSSNIMTKYDREGKEEWQKDNLVYTGNLAFRSDYPVGVEQKQTGTDDDDKPVYSYEEVKAAVMIAEYRLPTVQDEVRAQYTKITSLNVRITHIAAISGIGVEVSTSGQTLEELKEAKKAEINTACGQTVCNGITVELSTGFEHFSLSQSDQLNLFGLQVQLASGAEQIVYHADGQLCRFYPASDIAVLVEKAMFHVSYHVTYGNSLKTWIDSVKTEAELQEIFYGADVPGEYQSEVLKTYLAQIAAMARKEGAKR